MGKTSNAAKQRWCKTHRKQVKAAVPPEAAAAFRARCMAGGVSMASELSRFMRGQDAESRPKAKQEFRVATRPQRRKTLALLIRHIEAAMGAESDYMGAMPENLQNSCRYEAANETISALEEAISILSGAFE
jgi:hypothetical protein